MGMDGLEKEVPLAEQYMREFNRLMLQQRKGVHIDEYGNRVDKKKT